MKFFKFTLFFLLAARLCQAQDTTIVLGKSWIHKPTDAIYFMIANGWIFKQGNDTGFEKINIDTTGWKKLNPADISSQYADKNGRVECWFRIKIQLDSSLLNHQIGFDFYRYAATELFIDGKLAATRGHTGKNGKQFREYTGGIDPVVVHLQSPSPHLVAIHFVGYLSPIPPHNLKIWGGGIVFITGPNYFNFHSELTKNNSSVSYLLLSACALLSILFWLLLFQNKQEKNLVWIALFPTVLTLIMFCLSVTFQTGISSTQLLMYSKLSGLLGFVLILILFPLLLTKVFNRKINKTLIWVLILFVVLNFIGSLTPQWNSIGNIAGVISTAFILVICIYYVSTSWKSLKGAQWAIVFGLFFFISAIVIILILGLVFKNLQGSQFFNNLSLSLFVLSFPLSLLVYVSMRFKEIIREVQVNAKKVIELSEEKKLHAENQQTILQEEVNKQTAELRNTLDNLQSTQKQLIQAEKMASLGELTAGIAHEIQNPLNFVNNFSEVSNELMDEMDEELDKGDVTEAKAIAAYIKENLVKIQHHGKRADNIVKGMLQHSRTNTGEKELTDLNALVDESLRLSYHGMRAKDKNFNADIKKDFDESIGNVNLVPNDISRVLLNLFNNAFYAVKSPRPLKGDMYEPKVCVSTKKENGVVFIRVKDNGTGIPQKVLDKIFQPFFTTKPTGQGTGLGLSLSYDIVKAQGGEIKVESKEGEGTEFTIELPV